MALYQMLYIIIIIIIIGIQMNQQSLTKMFIMISNRIKPFGSHGLYKKNSAFQGLRSLMSNKMSLK